ncbi:hypothetical protein IFM89_021605 [Coptis chinensis]|uniref:Copper transport protein n=1 Tax=Coptis chinensis TaxID=261450 RepID=A0A835IDR0_9MAGN|nr:hypothetical protein IFM89_021605 [Coptis chinensis]
MEDRRIKFKIISKSKSSNSSLETPFLTRLSFKTKPARLASSVLFGVNSAIGYFLMLAIMSFNWGVFIAIVLGLSVGYLLFRSGGDDDGEVVVLDNPCACA